MTAPAKNLSAVLFDCYGTLVDISIDTEAEGLWERFSAEVAAAGLHLPPQELRSRYISLVDAERREHGEPFVLDRCFFYKLLNSDHRQLPPRLVRQFGRRFRELTTRHIEARKYVIPLLRALRESGCKVGLVSNTEGTVTGHDLDHLGLRQYFDAVVLSSEAGVKKPDRAIFLIALHSLGIGPQETVFVGDDYKCDFQGASSAGLRAILLGNSTVHPHAVPVAPSLEPILEALQQCGWCAPTAMPRVAA